MKISICLLMNTCNILSNKTKNIKLIRPLRLSLAFSFYQLCSYKILYNKLTRSFVHPYQFCMTTSFKKAMEIRKMLQSVRISTPKDPNAFVVNNARDYNTLETWKTLVDLRISVKSKRSERLLSSLFS